VIHNEGDRVTNTVPIGTELPAGSPGTVTARHEHFGSYGVTYDNYPGELAMDAHEIEAQQ
jgi:hypothetical protein